MMMMYVCNRDVSVEVKVKLPTLCVYVFGVVYSGSGMGSDGG